MSLYRCTIANDGATRRQIVVHWDDNDPNRHVTAPVTVAAADLDEDRLIAELNLMGFRMVSADSDNIGRGWAIVGRLRTQWPFYNPLDGTWQAFLSDEDKRAIAEKWPDADVPGTHR